MRWDDGGRSGPTRSAVFLWLVPLFSIVVVGPWTTPSSSALAFAPPLPDRRVAHHNVKNIVVVHESSSSSSSSKKPEEQVVEESLDDVDARVLQSLLADRKLDLDTEDDIRKLLERGTVKRVVVSPNNATKDSSELSSSEYSSKVLQKLSETKLFQKLRRNAFDFFESAGITILNKIERDVKVVAALGVFAWDRAVRDVGRALPASSSSSSSSSSAAGQRGSGADQKTTTMLPFMITANSTRPQDELRLVRESVAAIVKQGNDPGRSIRTAAPTGRANAKVRQEKAFAAQRQRRSAATDPTKLIPKVLGGAVIDTAYELKRELQVETSQPGYRTAPARAAIRAATKGLIDQARTAVALRAAERAKQQQQSLPLPVDYQFGVGTIPPPTKRAEDETIDDVPQQQKQQQQQRTARTDEAYTYSYQDLQDYSTAAAPTTPSDQQKAQKFQSDLYQKATIVADDVAIPTDVEFVRSKTTDVQTYEVDFANSRAVEVLTDDEDDQFGDYSSSSSAYADAKAAVVGDELEDDNEKDQSPNPFTQLALRSFDVVFFLLEKVFLVAVPETLATLSRVASRIEAVQRKGKGQQGWTPLKNLAPTKGRY